MLAITGYYENGVCVPTQTIVLKERQRVIITVLDENEFSDISAEKQLGNDVVKSPEENDSDKKHRLEVLAGLQKFRGRLSEDFDADRELAEAREQKYS